MRFSPALRAGGLALIVLCALAGCRSNRDPEGLRASPEVLYQRAQRSLQGSDYNGAIKTYEALLARFPFTDQARQARLDLMYAYYRSGESESAIDAADTFIRENPAHPRIDYAWYIKGLVDFERAPNAFERLFNVDLTERPPTTARKAFAAFQTVVQRFPKSLYAHDAQRRMIYLRNRLADYEVHVAEYYLRREAYVGAAQRAKRAVEQYDGAPALGRALQIMIISYQRLDLGELAAQTQQVYDANFTGDVPSVSAAVAEKPWWKFWR